MWRGILCSEMRAGFVRFRIGTSGGLFDRHNETSVSIGDRQIFYRLTDDYLLEKEPAI
jgi:hypothetical protein